MTDEKNKGAQPSGAPDVLPETEATTVKALDGEGQETDLLVNEPYRERPNAVVQTPIWDENNRLVDAELDEHFKMQSDIVLGKRSVFDVPEMQVDGKAWTEEEKRLVTSANVNMPYATQQRLDMTSETQTSPKPNFDPNQKPSMLTPYTDAHAANDLDKFQTAKEKTEADRIDNTISLENIQQPIRADEAGNVRGNPSGAEGGDQPPPSAGDQMNEANTTTVVDNSQSEPDIETETTEGLDNPAMETEPDKPSRKPRQ